MDNDRLGSGGQQVPKAVACVAPSWLFRVFFCLEEGGEDFRALGGGGLEKFVVVKEGEEVHVLDPLVCSLFRVAYALFFGEVFIVEIRRFGKLGEQFVPVVKQAHHPQQPQDCSEGYVRHVAGFELIESGHAQAGLLGHLLAGHVHGHPVIAEAEPYAPHNLALRRFVEVN